MCRVGKLRFSILLLLWTCPILGQSREGSLESIRSALRARDFDDAIKLSRAALQASPNDPQLWTLEGIALASKGHSKEALSAFTQALKFAPDDVAALEGAAQIEVSSRQPGGIWLPEPNLKIAETAWILAGGSHHTGLSQALTTEHLRNFAEMAGIECLVIDRDTKVADFTNALRWNEVYYHSASGFS